MIDGVEVENEEMMKEETEFVDPTKFPRMIYHLIEGQKIVNNPSQYEDHLKKGWTKSPEEFTEVKALQLKIKQTEEELKIMKDNLKTLLEEDDEEEAEEEETPIKKEVKKGSRRK